MWTSHEFEGFFCLITLSKIVPIEIIRATSASQPDKDWISRVLYSFGSVALGNTCLDLGVLPNDFG